jgi:predicted ester cyclase
LLWFDGTWFYQVNTTEENQMNTTESLARDVLDALSSGEIERAAPLVAEDFVDHGAPPWAPQGRAGYLQILAFLAGVLRLRYDVHEVVAAGDMVAIRATAHGIHNSGHLGFPATGKAYAMPTMHMFRQDGGVLTEHWGVRDELAALWQVGALPVPEPVALTPAD